MSASGVGLVAIAIALTFPTPARAQESVRPPRVELSAGGGLSGTNPDVGALASFPLGERVSFEIGVSYLARAWRTPAYILSQAQLRIPFRRHLRSRYSLTAGVTHLERLDPLDDDSGMWREDGLETFPHVGASLQWPLWPHIDLRVDPQLVIQGGTAVPVVPRIVAVVAWHSGPSGR